MKNIEVFLKIHSRIFLILFGAFLTMGGRAQKIEGCKALIKGDTLILRNDLTSHYYLWNGGDIIPAMIVNNDGGALLFRGNKLTDLAIPGDTLKATGGHLTSTIKRLSPKDDPYLEASIVYEKGELQIRRIVNIYPNSLLLSHHFHLKGQTQFTWGLVQGTTGREMIEKKVVKKLVQVGMGLFPLSNRHWKVKAVEFVEATDHNNTLVQQQEYLAFLRKTDFQGNLALASNPTEPASFILLKESPLSESQHGYNGFDFRLDYNVLQIVGIGLLPQDIQVERWTRGYGYAIGIASNSDKDQLMALRTYQKAIRKLDQGRDNMIISNTWGDRSRDSRMNEQFILEEIKAAEELGITHLQLDDGWQQGLSRNSASKAGQNWDDWSKEDWQPHQDRFPKGFQRIAKQAQKAGIEICLWFNPSKANSYALWERDADILIDYYKKWKIRVFKIDGVDFGSKQSELNLRKLFDKVLRETNGDVVFNLDVTAGHRMGYHYFTEYGNIFLENRYTDWGNYYPHFTLRNLWMLSRYVPTERFQIEFLNKWRNGHRYPDGDVLAPSSVPFEYQIAITLMSQPLAWMELSRLPEEAKSVSEVLRTYQKWQNSIHNGVILPIGQEPTGFGWTGFQSIMSKKEGFILVFREQNELSECDIDTWFEKDEKVKFEALLGSGNAFQSVAKEGGKIGFKLPQALSYGLFSYVILED
ncbi:MAG: alpha-galactosidase [Cyclobacteriaceae bacterium]|nr:alpha-galactosidase [Cyclobacteriaceae bacterium HetDA_MAG_MS6]